MPRERNYVARSPLMRKGGPHIKSKTGSRVRSRLKLEDIVNEWYECIGDAEDIHINDDSDFVIGEPEVPQDKNSSDSFVKL